MLTPVVSAQAPRQPAGHLPGRAHPLHRACTTSHTGSGFAGPLSRIVAQGPDGYFVAHTLDALGPVVQSEAQLQPVRQSPAHPADAGLGGPCARTGCATTGASGETDGDGALGGPGRGGHCAGGAVARPRPGRRDSSHR
ncbi:hypothetical protein [Nocardioides convexus]|uniref:hypothetical protein n=1 Tax=Nocardioides convexus TaxID=2712224 RepID=UPI00241876BE|nr:hypothetical protein [Nocardioides convexus]